MAHGQSTNMRSSSSTRSLSNERTPLLSGLSGNDAKVLGQQYASITSENPEDTEQDARSEQGSGAQPGVSKSSVWTVIPTLLLGVFLAQADSSIVLAISQQIASEFDVLSDAPWLITSYILAQCATQPLYGKFSDLFGRKFVLVFAYGFFTTGCLICGVGGSFRIVLLGRAISGMGSAGMIAVVSIVISDMLPIEEIATWRAYVNIIMTFGRAFGGPAGGFLSDTIGWRWSFIAQSPMSVLAALLVLWRLPSRTGKYKDAENADSETFKAKLARVDLLGVLFLPATLVCFFLGLDLGGKFMPMAYTLPPLLLSVFFGAMFYYVEKYKAKEPVLPIELVSKRDVYVTYAYTALVTGSQFIITYTIPIYFQVTAGMSATAAGSRIILIVIGNTVGGLGSGHLIRRTKRYKPALIFASCICCTAYVLVLLRWRGHTNWAETLYVIPSGLGMGITQSATFIHLTASLEPEELAIASASWFLSQSFGALVAANLFNVLHNVSLSDRLKKRLIGVPGSSKIIANAQKNLGSIWELHKTVREKVVLAFMESLIFTNGLTLVLGVFAALLLFGVRERSLSKQ